MRYSGALSQPRASVSWSAIHSAVGCAVVTSYKIRRRSWRKISKPYRSRNEIVGTTKRSMATVPSAWLRRKVVQPWDGGRLRRAMYLATLVCPTSMPSLSSSPWIRGAPHSGLARLMSRINWRISGGTFGRPLRVLDFQRQYALNPARCQRITVSGLTIASAPRTSGNSRKRPTNVDAADEKPFWHGPPQDVDLLAQHQVLRLERPSRSEQPDKRPPSRSAKVPHRTTASPDSQPLASRTRFATGTGGANQFVLSFQWKPFLRSVTHSFLCSLSQRHGERGRRLVWPLPHAA